jgi:mannitol-1-phosphate 5-dehydrogenase
MMPILSRSKVDNNKIVIFGAGKIGRSFVGQLFGCAGYRVVFVDINQTIVDRLNHQGSYRVVMKGEVEEEIIVPNVQAISFPEKEKVVEAVSTAGIMAVSVGKNALGMIIPIIAAGLTTRIQNNPGTPLDIILAENMRSAADFVREHLIESLPSGFPLETMVGLVETSIGKMVPIVPQAELDKDPLTLFAEAYNTLIVDRKGFKSVIPEIRGLAPKSNIKAWVDRKAFIHNLGHATVAYYGSFKYAEAKYIYEVLSDPAVLLFAKEVMLQSAGIIQKCYPADFSREDLEAHVNDLLLRFQNKTLKDTVFRVGQDRPRKLEPDGRFEGIIRLAMSLEMDYKKILEAMVYAFFYKACDENGNRPEQDLLFDNFLSQGLEYTLQEVCGFNPETDKKLIREVVKCYEDIKNDSKNEMKNIPITV